MLPRKITRMSVQDNRDFPPVKYCEMRGVNHQLEWITLTICMCSQTRPDKCIIRQWSPGIRRWAGKLGNSAHDATRARCHSALFWFRFWFFFFFTTTFGFELASSQQPAVGNLDGSQLRISPTGRIPKRKRRSDSSPSCPDFPKLWLAAADHHSSFLGEKDKSKSLSTISHHIAECFADNNIHKVYKAFWVLLVTSGRMHQTMQEYMLLSEFRMLFAQIKAQVGSHSDI
jgi:hypothetical protein